MTGPSAEKLASKSGKEEGEVSASDDDQPRSYIATPNCTTDFPVANTCIPPASYFKQKNKTGNSVISNTPAATQPMTLIRANSQRSEKKQVSFNSANPAKSKPVEANRNLVISFSDDDSSSESDFHGQKQTSNVKSKIAGAASDGKTPILLLPKSKGPKQFHRSISKAMPKRSSLAHTLIDATNFKATNTLSCNRQLPYRSSTDLKRNLGRQENCSDHIVGLNNHKLEDLRQQIQLRESKLKPKDGLPNMDTAVKNVCSARGPNAVSSRDPKAVSADFTSIEPKEPEPDKKRMKVSEHYPTQPAIVGRLQTSATVPSEDLTTHKVGLEDRRKVDHGFDVNPSYNLSGRTNTQGNPHSMSLECGKGKTSSNDLRENNKAIELNHPNSQSNFSYEEFLREQNLLMNGAIGGTRSCDESLKQFGGNYEPSHNNAGLWNLFGNRNASGHRHKGIQALLDLEESVDKELEEAQKYRHICELEERNAFKAYRKAQRSLIEASARCSELYRRREMCSANYGSVLMDDPNLLCLPSCHEKSRIGFGTLNNTTENADILPNLDPILLNSGDLGQPEYNQNIGHADNRSHYVPRRLSEQNLGSETCSEPDTSTSDRLPGNHIHTASRPSSLSQDPNISPKNDDDTFSMNHDSAQRMFDGPSKEENLGGPHGSMVNRSNQTVPADGVQDSLILEAALRSELFARLGMKTALKDGGLCNEAYNQIKKGAESDVGSEKPQMNDGTSRPGRSVSEGPAISEEQFPTKEHILNVHSALDLEQKDFSLGVDFSSTSLVFSTPLFLRSAFVHLKIQLPPIAPVEADTRLQRKSYILYNDEMQQSGLVQSLISERAAKMGSSTYDIKVDPFRPICMYELRGRCNNPGCPWQHFKDLSNENNHHGQHYNSDRADSKLESTLNQNESSGEAKTWFRNVFTSPTYHVCLDTMKECSHSYEPFVAQKRGPSRWKHFSLCVASSNLLLKELIADERLLHGIKGRIEVYESWRTHSSFFRSKSSMMNQLQQDSDAALQSVEMALLILSQEVNKLDGVTKALDVLSRSLEAAPTSEIVWIVYLLVYYSSAKSVGEDDMFSYAVKYNQGSYGLWLMYINSRKILDDQLEAYDAALRGLCGHASEIEKSYASASILDLFLQMINCLCMSGNVAAAVDRICGLLPSTQISNDSNLLAVSEILTCLTYSDKCVFWACCVYLIIYRKLPAVFVQGLELEKELVSLEWPLVVLTGDEKERALKLLETGVQSVELSVGHGFSGNEINLQATHYFALSHVQGLMALNNWQFSRSLLEKYVKLYPSCLELKLLVARLQQKDSSDLGFSGFEDIISNWPKETPGIQCVWNQYAEYGLRNQRHEFTKELLDRWYCSVWKVLYPQYETSNVVHGDANGSLELASSNSDSESDQLDNMFGFLNLSLHSLLQSNYSEAELAIDQALKAATPKSFMHCVREHALFVLNAESRKGGFPVRLQLSLLKRYLDHARSFPAKEPLSVKFIDSIEKARIRQLVNNLLTPISSELSLVNVVLEAWYGPSLLPQKLEKQTELVDFVEAILDLVPCNYPLALSLFKQLNRECSRTDGSRSTLFWAGLTLVDTFSCAVPIPPEYIWVEAANMLSGISGIESTAESFHRKVLSVYPFSVRLWKSFYNLSKSNGDAKAVLEAARKNGVDIV